MGLLLEIFLTFFKIGFVSFGGGYAMIPVIEREVEANGWLTTQHFTDAIAIAGMSPGPIAVNSAVIVGYNAAGLPGAAAAAAGITLPSFILVLLIAAFLYKFQENKVVKNAFYGLRPVIVGLVCYAAVKFAIGNNLLNGFDRISIFSFLIALLSIIMLIKTRVHPALVIIGSAFAGILLFR